MDDLRSIEETTRQYLDAQPEQIQRIPAGLGTRRFYRVALPRISSSGRSLPADVIARVEPERVSGKVPTENSHPSLWLPEPPLEPIRTFLESNGLPVPRSFAHDPLRGIDLLEDVGDRTLLDLEGDERDRAYRESGRLISKLQRLERPASPRAGIPAFERVFDRALLRTKAWKLANWGWPGMLGRAPTAVEREAIDRGFETIADFFEVTPRRLSHRDFKAENLHVVPLDDGGQRLVMIDVQGAFLAPPEYDLVCLLRDIQIDIPEAFIRELRQDVLATLPDTRPGPEADLRFDLLTLVRLAKDVSHLLDAAHRRGDRRRWHEIPRGIQLLREASERLQTTFPTIRTLNNVIDTLTRSGQPADIEPSRQGQ